MQLAQINFAKLARLAIASNLKCYTIGCIRLVAIVVGVRYDREMKFSFDDDGFQKVEAFDKLQLLSFEKHSPQAFFSSCCNKANFKYTHKSQIELIEKESDEMTRLYNFFKVNKYD